MALPRRTRRRRDALIAVVIAVAVTVVATVLWRGSDVRATSLAVASSADVPTTPVAPAMAPVALDTAWTLPIDPNYGAVASVYGTVVTADDHTVTGHDAATGNTIWSYSRTNRQLCAIGSGDTVADEVTNWSGVHGIMTVYAKNGYCSQVSLLNPSTGQRLYQRTSPNQKPGQLFFGAPYVGWMGKNYLELWRHDLVATIRYGNQPNPVNPDGPRLGCHFTDAAVTRETLATVEHCGGTDTARVVLNWPTPSDAPDNDDGWDSNHSKPKASIDTQSPDAVIVAVTDDRVAVAVSSPEPAIVVYDSAGTEQSRTDVPISAADIRQTARAGITPSVIYQDQRFSLIGSTLVVTSARPVEVPAPSTTPSAPADGDDASAQPSADASSSPETVTEQNPVIDWFAANALGLPAQFDTHVAVPVAAGLELHQASTGTKERVIAVSRTDSTSRVDATTVGNMIIERRSDEIVGLVPHP